jgi:hypothetical protein
MKRGKLLHQVTPDQTANDEYHPIPPQFMQSDTAIHKKDVALQNPPRDMPTVLDEVCPVPPNANNYAASKVSQPRRRYMEITVDPEQRSEEHNSSLNPQQGRSHQYNNLPTHQETTTEPDIIIPEAFLVTDEMLGIGTNGIFLDEIPSAEIVPTENYSVTIAGRKIHIGFLALMLILTSVIVGCWYMPLLVTKAKHRPRVIRFL